jgi:hypothetical protein
MSVDLASALAGAAVTAAERLVLPSGRLIAAEPTAGFPAGEAADWAFSETVPPGAYPVELLHRAGQLIAARVVVRAEPAVDWRPAERRGAPYIYPVDGGTGSFGSSEVFEALTDDEARDDLIADLSFDSDELCATYTDPAGDANLVAFRIGADGRYLTWTGHTATNDVACFLTDFGGLVPPSRM